MATKVTQTCDECCNEIKDFHSSKCVAVEHNSLIRKGLALCFMLWGEESVAMDGALHFHSDTCATRYLDGWLLKQRTDANKRAEATPSNMVDEHAPQPARAKVAGWVETVQESDSAVVDAEYAEVEEPKIVDGKVVACNCWRNGDPFAAPETHAASCPESLVSRRREVEAKETKPYAEAQAIEHPEALPVDAPAVRLEDKDIPF